MDHKRQRNLKNQKNVKRKNPGTGKTAKAKRKKIRGRIILTLVLMCLLAAAGFLFYRYTHPVELKDEVVNHELMEPFDPWDNVKHLYFLPLAQLQSAKILENGGIGEGEHAKL